VSAPPPKALGIFNALGKRSSLHNSPSTLGIRAESR
jgi:hypothetical protein